MELKIAAGTKRIEDRQFEGDESIESLSLPEGLESIGEEAFSGCAMLGGLILPESVTSLGAAAFCGCSALKSLQLPQGLRRISEGAFLGCQALKSVEFPPGLREIGAMAFWNTGLERISVPESVERVEDRAFWECPELGEADILNPDAYVGDDVFGICYQLKKGFIAPGYCGKTDAPSLLTFTLLWLSSWERHSQASSEKARRFVLDNEELIMERIFKYNNAPALTGLVSQGLLGEERMNRYVRSASEQGLTEITALLLKACGGAINTDTEFEL